ncbi:MAG: V-type ATP synthase subunit A, partial [Bacteroidales bacterium]|nr:V-type ATP synthase subunit A [Bacteroidales bacterium]
IVEYLDETVEKGWVEKVLHAKNLIRRGKEASEQINILGDDGVPMSYHVSFWKSELVDFVILQQDAFDAIDALCPLERQQYMLDLVLDICDKDFDFEDFEACRTFFKNLINELRQMNYSPYKSEQFYAYHETVKQMIA